MIVKKEDKDAQIIEAAIEEFIAKGLDAASMQNIALLAQVSKRTLYKYYSSKDDLFRALVDVILDKVEEMYSFNLAQDRDIHEVIDSFVETKIQLTLSESFIRMNRIIMGEMIKGRGPSEEQLTRFYRSELLFLQWIENAQKAGLITSDIEAQEIANQFHSILKGKIFWPVLMGMEKAQDIDREQAKESTVTFFMRSFVL